MVLVGAGVIRSTIVEGKAVFFLIQFDKTGSIFFAKSITPSPTSFPLLGKLSQQRTVNGKISFFIRILSALTSIPRTPCG